MRCNIKGVKYLRALPLFFFFFYLASFGSMLIFIWMKYILMPLRLLIRLKFLFLKVLLFTMSVYSDVCVYFGCTLPFISFSQMFADLWIFIFKNEAIE